MTATSAEGTPTGLLTKATAGPSMEATRRRRPKKSRVESSKETRKPEANAEKVIKRSVREPLELYELKRERHLGCVRTYIRVSFRASPPVGS